MPRKSVGHVAVDRLHPFWQRAKYSRPPVECIAAVVVNFGIAIEWQAGAIPARVDEVGWKQQLAGVGRGALDDAPGNVALGEGALDDFVCPGERLKLGGSWSKQRSHLSCNTVPLLTSLASGAGSDVTARIANGLGAGGLGTVGDDEEFFGRADR